MKNRLSKLKKLKKNTFSTKDAKKVGLDYYDLKVLTRNNKINKVDRGIYQNIKFDAFENEPLLNALAHLAEPSCICLLSAFSYYDLTDEIPNQVWAYVPINKYSHLQNIKVIRKRNPMWNMGIINQDGITITDIHRTVIDALSDRKHVTKPQAMKLAKVALNKKLTTLNKLTQMAKKLKVFSRVKEQLTLLQDEYV